MTFKAYSTITPEQIESLAHTLAHRSLPIIERFEPVADFEELVSFATLNPTPVVHPDRNPIWRMESVAARLIEALAVAAHEPTTASSLRLRPPRTCLFGLPLFQS